MIIFKNNIYSALLVLLHVSDGLVQLWHCPDEQRLIALRGVRVSVLVDRTDPELVLVSLDQPLGVEGGLLGPPTGQPVALLSLESLHLVVVDWSAAVILTTKLNT